MLDLRDWSPREDGPLLLSGDWAMWPGVLLAPGTDPGGAGYATVPGSWPTPQGVATYRLEVLLPPDPMDLSLRMAGASTAHRLFINGQERIGGGVVSAELAAIEPDGTRWIHGVPAGTERLELLVQVANAAYREGGLRRAPLLGPTDQILVIFQRKLLVDALIVVLLLAVGAYQLSLFFLRPKLRVHLPFGMLCLSFGVRATLSREGQIADMLLPQLGWASAIRAEYVLTWASLAAVLAWIVRMFPDESPRWAARVLWAAALLGVGFTVLAPVAVFTGSNASLQAALVMGVVLVLGITVRATRARREGAALVLVAALVGLAAAVWDTVVTHTPTAASNDLASLAFVALVLAETVRLARGYTRSFNVIERLSSELSVTNQKIVRFVPRQFLEVLGHSSILEVTQGENRQRTLEVMFFDIRGFTTLIESLGPQAAFPFLNALWSALEPEIRRHRGFVNHFLGDAVLAIFHGGADDALRGALAVHTALAAFNATQGFAAAPIAAGMGLNAGPIMMGIIGSSDRLDPNVVGDTVNLASRLEGMTKVYGAPIIVSQALVDRLQSPEAFALRELDRVRAQGKQAAVRIYAALGALPPALVAQIQAARDDFSQGLRHYRDGAFAAAEESFCAAAAAAPDDRVAALYVRRCRALRADPPPAWDGVTVLLHK